MRRHELQQAVNGQEAESDIETAYGQHSIDQIDYLMVNANRVKLLNSLERFRPGPSGMLKWCFQAVPKSNSMNAQHLCTDPMVRERACKRGSLEATVPFAEWHMTQRWDLS